MNWAPQRDSKADVSSLSFSSERIDVQCTGIVCELENPNHDHLLCSTCGSFDWVGSLCGVHTTTENF